MLTMLGGGKYSSQCLYKGSPAIGGGIEADAGKNRFEGFEDPDEKGRGIEVALLRSGGAFALAGIGRGIGLGLEGEAQRAEKGEEGEWGEEGGERRGGKKEEREVGKGSRKGAGVHGG